MENAAPSRARKCSAPNGVVTSGVELSSAKRALKLDASNHGRYIVVSPRRVDENGEEREEEIDRERERERIAAN